MQSQGVGDATRREAGLCAGAGPCVTVQGVAREPTQPATLGDAHIDGGLAALCGTRLARVVQRAPGALQEQSLLGVDADGLAGRHAEEVRVELVDAVDEATVAGVHLVRRAGLGRVPVGQIPAGFGHLGDGGRALGEQVPEGVWVGRAGEPAV